MIFIYNILFPFVFVFFIPGIIIKLIKRGGYKKTYLERFVIYSKGKLKLLKSLRAESPIWVHSVSVGETQLAAGFIQQWHRRSPAQKFVLSTTTTTGQELARKKLTDNATVIFNPVDFSWAVKRLLKLIGPKMVVIFETEIWPNMIYESHKAGVRVAQVNARISDHSFKGYYRFRFFITPFLKKINLTCAQTETDVERLKKICRSLNIVKTGTMKFDQAIPEKIPEMNTDNIFDNNSKILLAASTHPGEEKLISEIFMILKEKYKSLRLIIIPRHAERGSEIAKMLTESGISYTRRSENINKKAQVDCLLADTTGEMLSFMNLSDIVIMGKSFAGHDEGHNIIEPAILGKPVVCGPVLKNFRFVLKIMKDNNAVLSVSDEKLQETIDTLLSDRNKCDKLADNAKKTVEEQKGATEKTINYLEQLLKLHKAERE